MFLWLFLLFLGTDASQAADLVKQGLVALQQGRLSDAREALARASRLDPNNGYAWVSLAETYLRLKELARAAEAAQTAEKVGAENPVVSHALAMFYSESGEPERAFACAQTAEKQQDSPANRHLVAQAAFDYGEALLREQKFTQAADVLVSASNVSPDDAQLTLALGVARYGQRRFEDAVAAFLQVIQIDPALEQPYVFLGRMLDQSGERLGQITKACELWASRNPENAKAQLVFAKALLANDPRDPKAENLVRRSIGLDPNNWEAHYQLGILLESKHEYRGAERELRRGTELDPNEPMPHYHLARVYDRLGQPAQAKAERELHERLTLWGPR